MSRKAAAAFFFGLLVAFVVALALARRAGVSLLFDPDPSWAIYRFLLGVAVLSGAAGSGAVAAGGFLAWAEKSPEVDAAIPELDLPRSAFAGLAVLALVCGIAFRFAALERVPASLWIDDLSLIRPALELSGQLSDFANASRPAPSGVERPYGSVGVLYLEGFRAALRTFGANVFGIRFLAAAAGVVSIVTVFFLARSLLPPGGAALAAVLFAGLRWNLIVSRWGWNAVLVGPLVDVAAILLLAARRRRSAGFAAAAGAVAGVAAHVYLAAWCAAAALLVLALWPIDGGGIAKRARLPLALALAYAAGFVVLAAPLFLFTEGSTGSYFARASQQNVLDRVRRDRSPLPLAVNAADALAAPWFLPDLALHHDLPGRSRLGWLLGLPVAVALGRALCRPADELSGFLVGHAGAAFLASVAGGGVPNGYRFSYLADVTAVAAAAGLLLLTVRIPLRLRRAGAIAAIGVAAVSSATGARDALLDWPSRLETFQGFRGQDTMLARSALRWERYGSVDVEPGRMDSAITVASILRYRLDPDLTAAPARPAADGLDVRVPVPTTALALRLPGNGSGRSFRVAGPDARPDAGERRVETIRDAWGRSWGLVYGRRLAV